MTSESPVSTARPALCAAPGSAFLATMGQRSQTLQRILGAAGYKDGGGVGTPGIRLVSQLAKSNKLRDWPYTRTVADYDKLIEVTRAHLRQNAAPQAPRAAGAQHGTESSSRGCLEVLVKHVREDQSCASLLSWHRADRAAGPCPISAGWNKRGSCARRPRQR